MALRLVLLAAIAVTLAGCHGVLHDPPEIDRASLLAAKAEADAGEPPPAPRRLSEREARHRLNVAVRRVRAAGEEVCRELGLGTCSWRFVYAPKRTLNASVSIDGRITLNHGLAERAGSEEEICLVIAHEMGHLAADHARPHRYWYVLGWEIGWRVGVVVDRLAAFGGGHRTRGTAYGAWYGKWIGNLIGSRQREREADHLGVLIAYRAGIDLDRARGLELAEARRYGRLRSTVFDTHPLGAERLAAFDRAVAEVRATGGRLPERMRP